MKWPYPVGTEVKISLEGHGEYGSGSSNPINVWGTVTGTDRTGVTVKWNNGYWNWYAEGTLKTKPISLENK